MHAPSPAPEAPRPRIALRRRLGNGAICLILAPILAWCAAAIWMDGPAHRVLAALADAAFAGAAGGIVWKVRPFYRAAAGAAALAGAVIAWWLLIPASNDRDWRPEVARLASAKIEGDRATIENVRNFEYSANGAVAERWETRSYDLGQVRGFDMFLSFWGPTLIAHTIASWEFADGRRLAISIETRKEKGEEYSALRGFFRQYEIYYVVADERDVVGLRAAWGGERVFLYRTKHSPRVARALLEDYLREINRLAARPRWYNALTDNCTTSIRQHAREVGVANRLNWRLLLNGRLDELGYARGMIDTSLPLDELRRKSDITEKAAAAIAAPDFSASIREGLPGSH